MKNWKLAVFHLLPDKFTDYIAREAGYARYRDYKETTVMLMLLYIIGAAIAMVFVSWPLWQRGLAFVGLLPFSLILPYSVFSVMAERRKNMIETVLPDALLLMSANIESGMTVDKAFLMSARDEFGPLADDIRKAAMKMFSGKPADTALEELADSTNSGLFAETLKLLIDGLNSGGEVSSLLESSAEDIRKSLYLREEIAANVKMYSLFIMMAALLGAPVLFAVSTFLAGTTADLWAGQGQAMDDVPSTGLFEFKSPEFNVEFFRVFAVAALATSNAFAALIISEIKNGNIRGGLKYAPVYAAAAVAIFFIVDVVLQNTLGSSL